MQHPSFGKLPSGERLKRISASPNYKDGQFVNIHPTAKIAEDASYISMMYNFFSKGIDREPKEKLPVIQTDLKSLPIDRNQLIWFGHSSYLLILNGKTILIDPVFSDRPSPFQSIGSKRYAGTFDYSIKSFPDIDYVIITHDHYDHLDYNSIQSINDRVGHFITPLGVGSHLEYWGVDAAKITELDWWDNHSLSEELTLTSTPARHFSGRGLRGNKTLWTSYVLKSKDGFTLFLGGDSGYDDSFKKIGEKFGPFDLALLECGQYDPQWPYIHMMPEETIQAAVDLKARNLMPVHWGKFTLALHRWTDPIERAVKKAEELNMPLFTPMIGEVTDLSHLDARNAWWSNAK